MPCPDQEQEKVCVDDICRCCTPRFHVAPLAGLEGRRQHQRDVGLYACLSCIHSLHTSSLNTCMFVACLCRSNFHSPDDVNTVLRRVVGQSERVERTAPRMFSEYNLFMGGTDLSDQRRGYYTTQRRSKKWWHSLFYFTLDILMLNSWCVFNWEHGTSTPMTHKAFILSVAIDGLKQVDPINAGVYDPSPAAPQPDVLSPAAMATPPAPRFQCKKQQLGSIAKAKHYK